MLQSKTSLVIAKKINSRKYCIDNSNFLNLFRQMGELKVEKYKFLTTAILLLIIAVNLSFGLPRLSKFSAVDEHFWTYDRIPQYWSAIAAQKWKSTDINDKPGITVAILGGAGLLKTDPVKYTSLVQERKNKTDLAAIEQLYLYLRLPIYLFILLMAPLFYFFLSRLFNRNIALFSLIFIYLSPIILGISLFINPDSLLWVFTTLTILVFLLLQKTGQNRYSYICGIFLGLSLLTKYVSTILFLFLPLLIFLDYIFLEEEELFKIKRLKKSLLNLAKVILTSLVTIFFLYPAVWVDFKKIWDITFLSPTFGSIWLAFIILMILLYADTFLLKSQLLRWVLDFIARHKRLLAHSIIIIFAAGVFLAFVNTYGHMRFYDFEKALLSPKSGDHVNFSLIDFSEITITGFYVLIFSLTPIVLFFLVFALARSLKEESINYENFSLPFLALALFILIYYFGTAKNFVEATVRYQISLYPLASIMAGIGFYQFCDLPSAKFKKTSAAFLVGIPTFLIFISVISLSQIKPYYFAYASTLLPQEYITNPKSMGDGSYEAAQYLNSFPKAKELNIWTDKVAVCETFIGKCYTSLKKKNLKDIQIDYFVVSQGNQSKSLSFIESRDIDAPGFSHFAIFYSSDKFTTKKFEIGNRPDNFVKIIKNPSL